MEEYTDDELIALSEMLPAVEEGRHIVNDDYENAAQVDCDLNVVDE